MLIHRPGRSEISGRGDLFFLALRFLVDLDDPVADHIPVVFSLDQLAAVASHRLRFFRVGQERIDRFRDRVRVLFGDQKARLAGVHDRVRPGNIGRDHRRVVRHRLQLNDAESFQPVDRRENVSDRGVIKFDQLIESGGAEESDRRPDLELGHQVEDVPFFFSVAADDQFGVGEFRQDLRHRLHQVIAPFVAGQAPQEEQLPGILFVRGQAELLLDLVDLIVEDADRHDVVRDVPHHRGRRSVSFGRGNDRVRLGQKRTGIDIGGPFEHGNDPARDRHAEIFFGNGDVAVVGDDQRLFYFPGDCAQEAEGRHVAVDDVISLEHFQFELAGDREIIEHVDRVEADHLDPFRQGLFPGRVLGARQVIGDYGDLVPFFDQDRGDVPYVFFGATGVRIKIRR